MKLIKILPNVYGVKVPSDASNFSFHKSDWDMQNEDINCIEYSLPLQRNKLGNLTKSGYIEIGEDNLNDDLDFRVLGFLTKDEISFDASEVVESTEIDIEQYDGILVATPRFWDYELESFSCSSSDESFRSALPEDIYFENPFEGFEKEFSEKDYIELSKKHKTAQENITEKLLILQKL